MDFVLSYEERTARFDLRMGHDVRWAEVPGGIFLAVDAFKTPVRVLIVQYPRNLPVDVHAALPWRRGAYGYEISFEKCAIRFYLTPGCIPGHPLPLAEDLALGLDDQDRLISVERPLRHRDLDVLC